MPNYLNPSSFVMTLDSQTYSGTTFTIQTMILPDVSVTDAPLNFKQINVGRAGDKTSSSDHYRDLTLTVMNSANNVTKQIKFVDAYPTSLSSLPFDITTTDVEYLTAIASFEYSYYQFV